jgi:hypothetical protein
MRITNGSPRLRVSSRGHVLAAGLAVILVLGASPMRAQPSRTSAAPSEATEKPASVWANVFYGPNSVGAGAGIRSSFFGIGVSEFAFVGDSARSLPARPGGNFMTVDTYLVIDITSWLGTYGSFGWAGRISNHRGTTVSAIEQEIVGFTAGGGISIALKDRFVMGVGYSGVFMPIKGEGPEFNPMHRAVVQLGYQY